MTTTITHPMSEALPSEYLPRLTEALHHEGMLEHTPLVVNPLVTPGSVSVTLVLEMDVPRDPAAQDGLDYAECMTVEASRTVMAIKRLLEVGDRTLTVVGLSMSPTDVLPPAPPVKPMRLYEVEVSRPVTYVRTVQQWCTVNATKTVKVLATTEKAAYETAVQSVREDALPEWSALSNSERSEAEWEAAESASEPEVDEDGDYAPNDESVSHTWVDELDVETARVDLRDGARDVLVAERPVDDAGHGLLESIEKEMAFDWYSAMVLDGASEHTT